MEKTNKLTRLGINLLVVALLSAVSGIVFPLGVGAVGVITVGGGCSLADAVTAANTDAAVGGCAPGNGVDRVTLTGDVTLSADLPAITESVTIEGGGHTIDGASEHRAISIATAGVTVRLSDLVLANNKAPTTGATAVKSGGSIYVVPPAPGAGTAAISLALDGVTVRGSSSSTRSGGALACGNETNANLSSLVRVDITNSVFEDNYAESFGGAVLVMGACTLTISRSAFVDNRARGGGGAFSLFGHPTLDEGGVAQPLTDHRARGVLNMVNSTVAGNASERNVGGGFNLRQHTTVRLDHVTITDNNGNSRLEGYNRGGGIAVNTTGNVDLHVRNSIVWGNTNGDCLRNDVPTLQTNSGNAIGAGHGCGGATNPLSGDPGLVENRSGDVPFFALLSSSDAVDHAPCLVGATVDQRGLPRPRPGSSSATPCDIGAVESYPPPTGFYFSASGDLIEGGRVTITATLNSLAVVNTGVVINLGGTATFGGSMKETAAINAGALALLRRLAPNHRLLNLPPPAGSDYWTPGEGISVTCERIGVSHGVGQLTIPAGQTTASFEIVVLSDSVTDPSETVTIDGMLRGPDETNCVEGVGGTVCTGWAGRFFGERAETLTLTITDRPSTAGEQNNSPPQQNQRDANPQPQVPAPANPQPQNGQPEPQSADPQPEPDPGTQPQLGDPQPQSADPQPEPDPQPQQGVPEPQRVDPEPQPVPQPQQVRSADPQREAQPQLQVRELAAPGPIVGLSIDPHSKRLTVTWQAPTTGGAPDNYVVHLKAVAKGKGKHRKIKANRTTTTFRNLKPDTTYRIWVRAINETGKSPRVFATVTPSADAEQ